LFSKLVQKKEWQTKGYGQPMQTQAIASFFGLEAELRIQTGGRFV
jgi:hypothetical protein